MTQLYEADAVLLVGDDPTEQNPLVGWQIRSAIRHRASRLYIVNSKSIKLLRKASKYAEVPPDGEAAVRWLANGDDLDGHGGSAARRSRPRYKESNVVIVFGTELTGAAVRDLVKFGATLPGQTRYMALGKLRQLARRFRYGVAARTSARLRPGWGPEGESEKFAQLWGSKLPGQARDERARHAGGRSRTLHALYVVGANPVNTFGINATDKLGKLDLLVVQDLFLTRNRKTCRRCSARCICV